MIQDNGVTMYEVDNNEDMTETTNDEEKNDGSSTLIDDHQIDINSEEKNYYKWLKFNMIKYMK